MYNTWYLIYYNHLIWCMHHSSCNMVAIMEYTESVLGHSMVPFYCIIVFKVSEYMYCYNNPIHDTTVSLSDTITDRVKIVFHGSAYQLSKCTIYSFWILYSIQVIATLVGFAGLTFVIPILFGIGWTLGSTVTIIFAIFFPSLFISKLNQINKKTEKSMSPRSPTVSVTKSSKGDKSMGDNDKIQQQENSFLILIRKCTILTILSLISSWVVYICGFMEILYPRNFELGVVWGYAVIMDVNSNLLCIMLSNTFSHECYMKVFGCIDKCVAKNCCRDVDVVNNGLSSYIETTKTSTKDKPDDEVL